jgi:hypothetical protein
MVLTSWNTTLPEPWPQIPRHDGRDVVSTALPVGFLLEEFRAGTDFAVLDAELILVPDMSAGILTCTRDAVVGAFGGRALTSPALDIECFSAEDLWFVTVS